MRFLNWANPFSVFRGRSSPADLPSAETLRRILERERARADRTGQEFSFVVFDPDGAEAGNGACLHRLADYLARRIRATDVIGRFDEKSLGVVLPATTSEGAWKFADDVRRGFPNGAVPPGCTVFTYPSSWISGGGPPDAEGPGKAGREGRKGCGAADVSVEGREFAPKVHRMEKIFGRPLPPWKRVLDFLGAAVGLVLFSPLFLVIAVFIKLVSPGPAFFRQERVGHMGNTFPLWKFRTMHLGNDAAIHQRYLGELIHGEKPMEKLDSGRDPRIIPFGKILRQTCLDELPQLINVLRGDMSLVGPRPSLPYEVEEFLPWHTRRFDAAPGMTGLWQVNGKNRTTFKQMIRFDIAYARRVSLWMDFKILLKTVPAICVQVADRFAVRKSVGKTGGI